jgi:hypothetical protein
MSVQFIEGKPGGGKTLLSVKIIKDELKLTRRTIVTNVSLKLPELAAYCQEHNIDYGTLLLSDRIRLITEEQLSQFFLFRAAGTDPLPMKGDRQADFSSVRDCGVLYVLDEVHIAFNARRWQETGGAVIYYLSQHRKLGDDVVLISQSIQNVDKQMRSMGQDYTYVRNLTKEQHGLFRVPALFIKRVFLELPTGPSVKAIQTGTFKLDVSGLARCYDTAAGVGIVGRSGADIASKPKGLHWAWFVGGLIVLILAAVRFAPSFVEWVINPDHATSKAIAKAQPAGQPGVSKGTEALTNSQANMTYKETGAGTNRVSGFMRIGTVWRFCLQSGSIVYTSEPTWLAPDKVVLHGKTYDCVPGL